jgi:hypothetical protein
MLRSCADIDAGIRSLEEGQGKAIEIEQFIEKMNRDDGRS